jgi:adenosylcobinamide-phosphate synthase
VNAVDTHEPLLVLAAAVLWDLARGEPPAALHPVVWMGGVARALERRVRWGSRTGELLQGAAIAAMVPALFAAGAGLVLAAPWPLRLPLSVWLLKSSFAVRALGAAGRTVRVALAAGDLANARRALGSLCSRDASALGEAEVAAGAVESIAENTCDSVVAPLLFYACLGLPGAVAYRAVNTLDALIGYHGRYEYLGKASARLDDLLNLVPARASAGLLLLAGAVSGGDLAHCARILARDRARTASPNAGWSMAAMAGLLRVRLEKRGHYALGDVGRAVDHRTIDHAWRIAGRASVMAMLATALALCAGRPLG